MTSMALRIPFPIDDAKRVHSVQKCLFGRPTVEQQEKDFEVQESRLFEEGNKRFREKWGLDPVTGTFVNDAEYECAPVDTAKEYVPSFYFRGFAPRKPGPVRFGRERPKFVRPPLDENNAPRRPAKRKLMFEDEVSDVCSSESHIIDTYKPRVPSIGDVIKTIKGVDLASLPPTPSCDVTNSSAHLSLPSSSEIVDENGFRPKLCPKLLSGFKVKPMDLCTPPQQPGSLKQKTIKDFMPLKKARVATKSNRL